MARTVKVGQVNPIPHSKHLGFTWVDDYCCIVRLDELRRGDTAVLVEPGEAVPTYQPEFAFLRQPSSWFHEVEPVRLFGYVSEALLVPSRRTPEQLGIIGAPEPPRCMTPLGASLAIGYGLVIGITAVLAGTGVIPADTAFYVMCLTLAAYAIIAIALNLKGSYT